MKALITTRTETSITTSEMILRGKPQTQNQKIAEEVERRINKELYAGRKPYEVEVMILNNNRVVNKWIYKPTIR